MPRQAERPLTPFMSQQIRVHRQLQGPPRIETRPEFRPLARPETAPQVEVIRGLTSQKIHPSGAGGFQSAPGATTPEVIRSATTGNFTPPGRGIATGAIQGIPSDGRRRVQGGVTPGISPTLRVSRQCPAGIPGLPPPRFPVRTPGRVWNPGDEPGAARIRASPDVFSVIPPVMRGGLNYRPPTLQAECPVTRLMPPPTQTPPP